MPDRIQAIKGEHTEHNGAPVLRVVPPKETFAAFEKPVALHDAIGPGQTITPTYLIDTPEEGGILNWQMGKKYPLKSWPFKEAVFAIDTIKRPVLNALKFASSSPARYMFAVFFLFPSSWKDRVLKFAVEMFVDYTSIVFDRWGRIMRFEDSEGNSFGLQSIVRSPNYYCDMVREIRRVGMKIAGDYEPGRQLVETICMAFEFDDGYRYPVQDLFGEFDVNAFLSSPAKETARILAIAAERGPGTREKFKAIARVLPFLFRVKSFRNVMVQFFSSVDIKKIRLDDIDFYACLERGGWAFGGVPDEERASLRMMLDAEWQINTSRSQETKQTQPWTIASMTSAPHSS